MKEFQSKERFCYLKNELTYPSKNCKLIFLLYFFLKTKKLVTFFFKNDVQYVL